MGAAALSFEDRPSLVHDGDVLQSAAAPYQAIAAHKRGRLAPRLGKTVINNTPRDKHAKVATPIND
jgi:hypothetical protein